MLYRALALALVLLLWQQAVLAPAPSNLMQSVCIAVLYDAPRFTLL